MYRIRYKIAMYFAHKSIKILEDALEMQKNYHDNLTIVCLGFMEEYAKLYMRIAVAFDKRFLPAIKGE